jgi:hypothetical protein
MAELALVALLAGLAGVLGCSGIPPHPDVDAPEGRFSPELLRAHLSSLERLYPRLPESDDDEIARAYLRRELSLAGADVRDLAAEGRRHLVARIEGASPDRILLVAAYPSLVSPLWVDDAGAVLLLELARVFGRDQPAYTIELALAEVEPARAPDPAARDDGGPAWMAIASREEAREALVAAGRSLARAMATEDPSGRLRAVIAIDVSARGGLRLARDLRSHPVFRDLFWQTAADLGWEATFPSDDHWSSPESLHTAFRSRSMDRVLALVDVATDDPPTSPRAAAIDPVGFVTVEALTRLMQRFQKVDAFAD